MKRKKQKKKKIDEQLNQSFRKSCWNRDVMKINENRCKEKCGIVKRPTLSARHPELTFVILINKATSAERDTCR